MKEKATGATVAGGSKNPGTSLPSPSQPGAEHQAADSSIYNRIKAEVEQLIAMGLQLATVIPVELSAEQYPLKRKNKAGMWEVVLKDGKPQPKFTGKNPSYWAANGEPQTIKHGNPPTGEQVLAAIATAERLGKSIGLSILPTNGVGVADFDPKDYEGGVQELQADFERLLADHPELKQTRIERTPSGGIHIYLRPTDGMEGWKKPGGGHCGQFTTDPGGQKRGEMLAGTRVSVTAPTFHRSSSKEGTYSCLHSPYNLLEVPSLESVGIYPAKGKGKPEPQPPTKQSPTSRGVSEGPQLIDLLGKSAQEVLKGDAPYGDDRSSNLTGFLRELYGVCNLLDGEGLPYRGTAEQLIQQAIEALDIEDKAERVLNGITPADCDCDIAKARRRYEYQLRAGGPPGPNRQPSDATVASTRSSPSAALREAISEGASQTQVAELVASLAEEYGQSPFAIQRIAESVQADLSKAAEVQAEAAAIAAEADRRDLGSVLTPSYLLPQSIARAVETRCRYLPTDGPSAVLPFLVAVAGLVKLGTFVLGNAAAGLRAPINLYGCLVGRSGAKKSPLSALMVIEPTAELKAELDAANQRDHDAWADQCKSVKKGEQKPPAPKPKRLRATTYSGEALEDQLQVQEASGLGLLIYRDELKALFDCLNQYRAGKGGDEQQLLELFDGGGATSLRISGNRHFSRSQVSIWGNTQPKVLRQLVANGDDTGLWARFLFVPLPERVVALPQDNNPAEEAEMAQAIQALRDACRAVYRMAPQTYRLTPEAAERFARYELNHQRSALKAHIGAASAVYGKSAGKALRVAGVLHLLQIAAGEAEAGSLIEAHTIDRATSLVDHLDAWALSLHSEVAAGGIGGLMRAIHRIAEGMGPSNAARWKDISAKLSKQQREKADSAACSEAMRALADAGYGEISEGAKGALAYRALKPLP